MNEIQGFNGNDLEMVQPTNSLMEVEKDKAIQQVQAKLIIAKRFPRDINASYTRIMKSCERIGLAERAVYSYPKGGAIVRGASIRLAEVMAQNWGNIDFGIKELERKAGASVVESYCWDTETNTNQSKIFEVPHEIGLKGGKKKLLTDSRDIYELVANQGARRLRACILGIIPKDIEDAALEQCQKTLEKGVGKSLQERIRLMILAFSEVGVSQEMLEKKLGHKMDLTITKEIVDLTAIYTSIRDGHVNRSEFFDFPTDLVQAAAANELSEQIRLEKEKAQKASAIPVKGKKKGDEPDTDPNSFGNFQG